MPRFGTSQGIEYDGVIQRTGGPKVASTMSISNNMGDLLVMAVSPMHCLKKVSKFLISHVCS